MQYVKKFGEFWWDFIVGDDWLVAVLVVAAIAATALFVHLGAVNAWWLLPLVVVVVVPLSIRRQTGR